MPKYSITRTELVTKLKNWAESEETTFETELDTVINLACVKVARDLKLEKFRKRATGNLVAATATIDVPDDVIVVDSVLVSDNTNYHPVEERSGDVMDLYGGTGLPKYWTEQDTGTLRFAPTPDDTYPYIVHGIQRPEKLVETTTETNWLTANVPDLLFLACLEWSMLFLKNDQRADAFKVRYEALLLAARDEFGSASRNTDEVAPATDASTGRRTETQ